MTEFLINLGSHYGHGTERRKGDDLVGADSPYDSHRSNPGLSFPIQGCLLLLFSSLPLPIFLFLLHIPLVIQPLYSLCPFFIHFSIFFNHTLLSLPVFWFLTPAVLWPLLSHMQVPPHSDSINFVKPHLLGSWSWPFFLLCSRFFFPLSLFYLKGMVHTEFYQHWWHKLKSTE